MIYRIDITQDFIDWRDEKAELYNGRGRSKKRFLMDIECEVYEWFKINNKEWESHDDWKVDAITPEYGLVDVKFIDKWYNISATKMHNILQQRKVLDGFYFCEWIDRPVRPLVAGDNVSVGDLGFIGYEDLIDIIQVSRGKWGGHYADVRKFLSA